ncbi:MAG: DUF4351 domain-containing protein [Magnetococcus sp. YQC-5]
MPISIDLMENSFIRNLFMKAEQKAERNEAEKIFMRLVVIRFGDVSAEVRQKVAMADMESLEHWIDRLLDAQKLEDLFDN